MKISLSKRVLAIICVFALVLSIINTYFVLDLNRALREAAQDSAYDFVIFQDGAVVKARNQASGSVVFASANASQVIGKAIAEANRVYIRPGNYTLGSDVEIYNKENARIVGDGARVIGNGNKLILKGEDYTRSQNNVLSGLTIINGTVRVENSFRTTISSMFFEDCSTALEFANTETWSEGIRIEDCHFVNCTVSVGFRKPVDNTTGSFVTGSYASTEIRRCYFNLPNDAVGIVVEKDAELSDSQIQNVRMWMGENGFMRNQTGLLVDGTMHQSLLFGVVFESFADYPDELYAIALGSESITSPILAGSVSFLGNWTAKIHNPFGKWIGGFGSVFERDDLEVQAGVNGQYGPTTVIKADPLTITSVRLKIEVQGSFANNEIITVRLRLEYVDNTFSSIEKTFHNSTVLWLSDDDILRLYPSQNMIWAMFVDAKVNSGSADAVVRISVYGTVI
ncbi:MAG TPA: hypothetical protein VF893_05125 [Candidatus Bathyarchaeia archaeon]